MKEEIKYKADSNLRYANGDEDLTRGLLNVAEKLYNMSSEADDESVKEKLKEVGAELVDLWNLAFRLRTSTRIALLRMDRLESELNFRKKHPIKNWFNPI